MSYTKLLKIYENQTKALGPTSRLNGLGDIRKYPRTTHHTTKDRKEAHPTEGENASKQLLQKPNKGKQTEEILVSGERRRRKINKYVYIQYLKKSVAFFLIN